MLSRLNVRVFSTKSSVVRLAHDQYGLSSDKLVQPLVIAHGLFGQKKNWRSLAKSFQKQLGNQVYVIDLRNHGDSPHHEDHTYPSMTDDLELFVREVVKPNSSFDTIHLLGHSMGGKVVADFALRDESLVEKLIIEDIAPHRPTTNNDDHGIYACISAMKGVDLSMTKKEITERMMRDVSNPNILQFLLMNLVEHPLNKKRFRWKINLSAIDNYLEHVLSYSVVGAFSKPTLFVFGSLSNYIYLDDHASLSHIFKNATFVSIENAGHWLHAEQPKLFLDCVVDFLKK